MVSNRDIGSMIGCNINFNRYKVNHERRFNNKVIAIATKTGIFNLLIGAAQRIRAVFVVGN